MKTKTPPTTFVIACLMGISATLVAQPQPGTVLWTYDVGSWITGAPALAPDGTLYVGTYSGLCAVTNNGTTASNKWGFPAGNGGPPAIASDGTIYFGSSDLNFYAVNRDGSSKWVFQFHQIRPSSAAIAHDGTVYVQGDGILYAMSPGGVKKWAYTNYSDTSFGPAGSGSPVIGLDGTIYVCTGGSGALYANASDGSLKWSYSLGGGAGTGDSAAIANDGTIYFTAGLLFAMTPKGTNLWTTFGQFFSTSTPVVGLNGTIYAEPEGHKLAAVSPSGEIAWQILGDGDRYNPPATPAIDAASTIYYCASNSVLAVNAQGQVQWTVYGGGTLAGVYLATTSPVVGSDGTVYAALGSKLYAIYNTNKLADSPWPMYRQNARHTGKIEKPSLQQPKKRADANFEFQLYSQIDQTQNVQTSTDLVTWSPLTNIVVTNVPLDVVDLSASNFTSRFYRTLSQ